MRWVVMALAAALAACATEDPPAETRPAAGVSRPAARPARPPPRPTPPAEAAAPAWRAATDGITACADPATLLLLREAGDGELRRLASARAAGGCVTVFRASAWRAAEREGGMIRLAPAAGGAALWFWRDEVTEERG
jgi:hypothetical protein